MPQLTPVIKINFFIWENDSFRPFVLFAYELDIHTHTLVSLVRAKARASAYTKYFAAFSRYERVSEFMYDDLSFM